jgi:hypothetical protein
MERYFNYLPQLLDYRALDDNGPYLRAVEPPGREPVVGIPQVGGLHHGYTRVA